jgi:hypothetical protein
MSTLPPSEITPASKLDIAPPQTTPMAHLDEVAKALALLHYEDECIEPDPTLNRCRIPFPPIMSNIFFKPFFFSNSKHQT